MTKVGDKYSKIKQCLDLMSSTCNTSRTSLGNQAVNNSNRNFEKDFYHESGVKVSKHLGSNLNQVRGSRLYELVDSREISKGNDVKSLEERVNLNNNRFNSISEKKKLIDSSASDHNIFNFNSQIGSINDQSIKQDSVSEYNNIITEPIKKQVDNVLISQLKNEPDINICDNALKTSDLKIDSSLKNNVITHPIIKEVNKRGDIKSFKNFKSQKSEKELALYKGFSVASVDVRGLPRKAELFNVDGSSLLILKDNDVYKLYIMFIDLYNLSKYKGEHLIYLRRLETGELLLNGDLTHGFIDFLGFLTQSMDDRLFVIDPNHDKFKDAAEILCTLDSNGILKYEALILFCYKVNPNMRKPLVDFIINDSNIDSNYKSILIENLKKYEKMDESKNFQIFFLNLLNESNIELSKEGLVKYKRQTFYKNKTIGHEQYKEALLEKKKSDGSKIEDINKKSKSFLNHRSVGSSVQFVVDDRQVDLNVAYANSSISENEFNEKSIEDKVVNETKIKEKNHHTYKFISHVNGLLKDFDFDAKKGVYIKFSDFDDNI